MSKKLLLMAVVLWLIGIPVDTTWQFAAIGLTAVIVLAGELRPGKRLLLSMALAAVIVQILRFFAAPPMWPMSPMWQEGMNLFVPNQHNLESAYRGAIPDHVLSGMTQQFHQENPAIPCDQEKRLPWGMHAKCWTDLKVKEGRFARAAENVFSNSEYSRLRYGVNFRSDKVLSADFLYDVDYVWQLTPENKNQVPKSFYVSYPIPSIAEGGRLCWQGRLYWDKRAEPERSTSTSANGSVEIACRTITSQDVNDRLWSLQANAERPLTLSLELPPLWRGIALLLQILPAGVAIALLLQAAQPSTQLLRVAGIFVATLALIFACAPEFFQGLPRNIINRDALLYLSWGREIAINFVDGNIGAALMGGERIYVFMPGMRYFIAAELLLFGNSNMGHLLCIALLPPVIYLLTQQMSKRVSLFVVVLILSSTKLIKTIRTAADGYSDPLGLLLLSLALLLLMRQWSAFRNSLATNKPDPTIFAGFVALGLSIFLRPNYVLVGMMIGSFWLMFYLQKNPYRFRFAECLGILIVLTMPAHNLFFGHAFVALTLASTIIDSLTTPPLAYWNALQEASNLAPGPNVALVVRKLKSLLLPGHWVLFFGSLFISLVSHIPEKIRLLAAAAFLLQAPHLFYRSGGREMLAGNYFALMAVLAAIWFWWDRKKEAPAGPLPHRSIA
jgi:hypothetical protein